MFCWDVFLTVPPPCFGLMGCGLSPTYDFPDFPCFVHFLCFVRESRGSSGVGVGRVVLCGQFDLIGGALCRSR